VKNQDSMGKTNFFLSTLPFNPWAVLATWLHIGAPQKTQEKWTQNLFWTKIRHGPHTESEFDVLGVLGKLVKYIVRSSKRKNWKKMIFLQASCPNNNRLVFGFKEF
jgi:hypothetical protein